MTEIVVTHTGSSTRSGQVQRFAKERVRLGRRPDNDVAFDPEKDRAASGYHAELLAEQGGLLIKDLGSQNGTMVNGQRIAAPTPLGPTDTVRLGDGGPELRASLAGSALAATSAPPAAGKGIGAATLHRAVGLAVHEERKRTQRTMVVGATVVAVLGGALGLWQVQKSREASRVAETARADSAKLAGELAEARKALEGLRTQTQGAVDAALAKHAEEVKRLEGKIGAEEGRVAQLMVEISARDRAMTELQSKQSLTDRDRELLEQETRAELGRLRGELDKAQEAARKAAGAGGSAPDWANLAERYAPSTFLVVVITKNPDGTKGRGTGTAWLVDSRGLLATNAHVVQPLLGDNVELAVVIQSGTGRPFVPKRGFVHPDFNGSFSPDVGLIEFATEGEKLEALPLASDAELRAVRIGMQIGSLGFPGELAETYLRAKEAAEGEMPRFPGAVATFKDGWVGRLMTYDLSAANFDTARLLQHSASLSRGTSGTALFDATGRVIAVHNSGLVTRSGATADGAEGDIIDNPAEINWAIRVDELRRFMDRVDWKPAN